MPRFSKNKIIKIGYQLDENSFRELEKIINELSEPNNLKSIYYNVYLKDSSSITDLSLDELLNLPNVHHSIIDSIIVNTELMVKNFIMITFNNQDRRPIEYRLYTENKKDLLYFQSKFEEFFHSLKTMYSGISISQFFVHGLLFLPVFYLMTRLLLLILNSAKIDSITWYIGIPTFLIGFFLSWIIGIYKTKFFPVGDFKIGNGIVLSERNKWIRNTILLTAGLSILASIIDLVLNI